MTQTQLLNEFRQLSLQQQLEMLQASLRILTEQFQASALSVNAGKGHVSIADAAHLLAADYRQDSELTSFTALDGEPFYASS